MSKMYRVYVKNSKKEWTEVYKRKELKRFQGTALKFNPEECAKNIILYFNSTLRPGEIERQFVKIEKMEDIEK